MKMTVDLKKLREKLKKQSIEIKKKELVDDKEPDNDASTDKADDKTILIPNHFWMT